MRKIVSMLMVSMIAVLALGNVCATPSSNCDPLAPKVDQILASYIQKDSPGAAVLIMKENRIIYQNGYGMANLENEIPITQDTVFEVASNSKQFTAFAILLLSTEGKLSLDDDIRTYLPRVPDFGKKITIRNLLYHTSGLRDYHELMMLAGWSPEDLKTQENVLRLVSRQKNLNFDPGTEFMYCNTGYALLAEIVAKVSGQTFAEFTQQRIFKPLGMKHTFFRDDYAVTIKNLAESYSPIKNQMGFRKCILSYSVVGSTNLFTTTGDLAKWIQNFETCRVGNQAMLSQMQTPGQLNNGTLLDYACGLFIKDEVIWHGGDVAGYHSVIVRFPVQRFAVAVLGNLDTIALYEILDEILGLYIPSNSSDTERKAQNFNKVPVEAEMNQDDVGRNQLFKMNTAIKNSKNHTKAQVNSKPQFELHHAKNDTTPAQLTEYCGEYYSEELETIYKITLQDNQLIFGNLRLGEYSSEVTGDQFLDGLFTFQRNNNQITGILYNGDRVRNLRFVKVK